MWQRQMWPSSPFSDASMFYSIGQSLKESTKRTFIPKGKGRPSKLAFPNSAAGIFGVRASIIACCLVHYGMLTGIPGLPSFCTETTQDTVKCPTPEDKMPPVALVQCGRETESYKKDANHSRFTSRKWPKVIDKICLLENLSQYPEQPPASCSKTFESPC